jgi:hypothetical protein
MAAMEWGEGTPWRPSDLREDARAHNGDFFVKNGDSRVRSRAGERLWLLGHTGTGHGAGRVRSRAGDSGGVHPDGRTTEQEHYRSFMIGAICYRTCKLSCGISLAIMIKKNHYLKWT